MADGIINNLYLINAPAGSGKTTKIKSMITDILLRDTESMILCITYTNRAAEELMSGIESERVQIQTIHSFISSFMGIYFSHKEILDLYFEIYSEEIKKRIENIDNRENIASSNEKYKEQFGKLDYETVKKNISKIQYNELSFNTLYYGGISHDDLLDFSKKVIERYPIIKMRISQKYQYIFIDEYQDTSSSVLDMFYQSVKATDTKLFLFGDKMQQIYKNYDGSFEKELSIFDTSIKLDTNYRSTSSIIDILNNIYNDKDFIQHENTEEKKENIVPCALICKDIEQSICLESKIYPNALKLYVFNKQRFNSIGAGNLYNEVDNMDKYGFGRKYGAVDVLTNETKDNPDELFKILFFIRDMYNNYILKKYGVVIQLIKHSVAFNKDMLAIHWHSDKKKLNRKLATMFDFYNMKADHSIGEFLQLLVSENIVLEKNISEFLNSEEYENVLKVPIIEFRNLSAYLGDPHVSTQHGVKGEGHESVFFISEDSSNPTIKMYDFFSIWANVPISFTEFQSFYYSYLDKISNVQEELGIKISDLNKDSFCDNETIISNGIYELYERFKDDKYFKEIYLEDYQDYIIKQGVTKAKRCLNINTVYGILSAYKLFYVGCSRARKKLTVFIAENKIKGDKQKLVQKLNDTGFKVVYS